MLHLECYRPVYFNHAFDFEYFNIFDFLDLLAPMFSQFNRLCSNCCIDMSISESNNVLSLFENSILVFKLW